MGDELRGLAACVLVSAIVGCDVARPPSSPTSSPRNQQARQLLCADLDEKTCVEACPDGADLREHADCLMRLRLSSDPEALELARSLYTKTNALVGVDASGSIDGYGGQDVPLYPALPIGEHRHHLAWLRRSLVAFEAFIVALAPHAPRPVKFQPRPRGFVFYQTAERSFPSAYCSGAVIGYNVRGPLNSNWRDMHETLFHELFHVNDEEGWTSSALGALFDSIVERCGDQHECLAPFSPHTTIVPGGTYYAFDRRTRDVREYGAELALRYFLEHEAILASEPPVLPSFKCLTEENRLAWERLADALFGGANLTPSCANR